MSTGKSRRRFLVTGAHGCIGAWTVHELAEAGEEVVTLDVSTDPRRLALLLPTEPARAVPHVVGDISDLYSVERALDEHGITNVIHLAALQVPFVRADPPLGARVNVLGTVNIFEAVRRRLDRMAPIVYASSIAAFDAPERRRRAGDERASRDAVRRLQARERGHRVRSTTPRTACRASACGRTPCTASAATRG